MYAIFRFINGICLNPKEYVLNDNDTVKEFRTQEDALEFAGYDDIDAGECEGIYIEDLNEAEVT